MKKLIILFCTLIVILLTVTAVKTSNTTSVFNDGEILISDPENSLISIIPAIPESPGYFRQGETGKSFIIIRNNTSDYIDYTLDCSNDLIMNYIAVEPVASSGLSSGSDVVTNISINNYSPTGFFDLGLLLAASWSSGNASIKSMVNLEIKEGLLELIYENGNLFVKWNGEAAPPETGLFYSYAGKGEKIGEWKELHDIKNVTEGLPGTYIIKAMLGKTSSNELILKIEPLETIDENITQSGESINTE